MSLSDYLTAELAVPNHTINLTEFEIFATTSLVESIEIISISAILLSLEPDSSIYSTINRMKSSLHLFPNLFTHAINQR